MIRRDYILRMIREFVEMLRRVHSLKELQQWRQAAKTLDQQFERLVGVNGDNAVHLTESELFARLIQQEPDWTVHDKTLVLTALLKEAGDIAVAEDRHGDGEACYLKGLHLLLSVLARDEVEDWPEFVPGIEAFVIALHGSTLPAQTRALLMQHYERTGEFAKAEDNLYELINLEPGRGDTIEFGIAFYERLQRQSDAGLQAGNLPRPEVESALAELREKRAASISR